MSTTETIKQELQDQFGSLEIKLQRERRLWVEVNYDMFFTLFNFNSWDILVTVGSLLILWNIWKKI